ncbi:MAG TPA: hypothetical protein DDX86_07460 [Akkermansia sp.]|nr:hypothetical protein [Akkermansia sp.]
MELCFSSCANPADGGPAAEGEESVLLRVADMAASAAYVMDFSLWGGAFFRLFHQTSRGGHG